ncbi:ribosomal biogenesis protein LAS1L [Bufo gargarizans]|uniref:ribosomal biogenesis protein LAS1L n=1 Tax=Bufo gargarizans TaxID=30331 RepID=UPI001CF5E0E2|nr:ribosomal biogenesis protein LAS1L [Bufo gargarizans]
MAGRRQVVAWISKAEWEQVLEYLYSRDCKLQRDALHQISAWKSRYGNSMPLAVECTADLVRCKILDVSGGMGEQELELLYGLALVRFVNIITEPKQKNIAIPLRRLANELKIPEWVVNLRHSATHGKLPKLSLCRKGWDFVMDWLRREYWSRQLGNSSNPQWMSEENDDSEEAEEVLPTLSLKEQKRQTLTAKLRESLQSYTSEQFKIFEEQQKDSARKPWTATANLEWIIAQVKELVHQNSVQTAVDIFLQDGFLIPTGKQLSTLKIEPDEVEDLRLPRTLLRLWQPLLKVLHSQTFTQELLEKMFAGVGNYKKAQVREHYLICWIAEILTANYRADKKYMVGSRNQTHVKSKWKFFSHSVSLQWKKLMQKCLEFPCQMTPQVLQLIFSNTKNHLPLATQEKLLCLCSIYIQDAGADGSIDYSDQPIYTVESLQWKIKQDTKTRSFKHWGRSQPDEEEEEMSEQTEDEEMITEPYEEYIQMINRKAAAERRAALEGSAWGVSSEFVKWGEYPLGVVPGQTEDPGCLLIDSYSMMSVLEQQDSESRSIPMSSPAVTTAANKMYWSQGELNHIKAGLRLF